MHRVETYLESKYLGLALVGSLTAFGVSDMNGWIAATLSIGLMGTYWSIYRNQ